MKNWKFIKVENKDTPELREKLRDIDEQIKNWEHAKGIDGVEKQNAQKNIDDLKKERSKIQQEITTGNTAHSDKVEVIKRLLAGGWSVEDIYSLLKTEGYEVEKGFIEKLKVGNKRYFTVEEEGGNSRNFSSLSEARSFADKWRSEGKQTVHIFEIEENDKDPDDFRVVRTINSSIQSQEWSMFKGLAKDAEKEVGNEYKANPELIKILEAWLHNRMSEQEARAKIMKITGDKNITDMMIHSPGGFIPAGNKKVGNAGEGWYTLVGSKQSKPKYKEGQSVKTHEGHGVVTKVQPMKLSSTPTYKIKLDSGKEIWAYEEEIGNKKVGNKYEWVTRNGELQYFDYSVPFGGHKKGSVEKTSGGYTGYKMNGPIVISKKEFGTEEEAKKFVENKVGNWNPAQTGKPGTIAAIGPAWTNGGTVYGKMDTDENGKKHTEYVKITWLGEGKGGVANYFIDDKMQSDKLGSLDKNELKRWAEQKIGNKKAGNNLCRARNAIKTKNADVTLWKDNDTVYIKEDGHVQYLENNSFVVDEDKYDSQEKAIEDLTKKGYHKK